MSESVGRSERLRRHIRVAQIIVTLTILAVLLFRSVYRNAGFLMLEDYFLTPRDQVSEERLVMIHQIFDRLSLEGGKRYQAYSLHLEALIREGADPTIWRYDQGSSALHAARVAALLGEVKTAIAKYQMAVDSGVDPVRLVAQLEWADLLARHGDPQGSDTRYTEAAASVPEAIAGLGECSGWKLRGGFLDHNAIETDQPVTVVLVWQVPAGQGEIAGEPPWSDGEGLRVYRWRDLVFQVGEASNLVPDGGFVKAGFSYQGLAQGYSKVYKDQLPSESRVVADPYEPERQSVLMLDSRSGHSVGIHNDAITVPQVTAPFVYLLAVTYRSDAHSRPRIGLRWFLHEADNPADPIYAYAVRAPATNWTSLIRLYPPPTEAETVQFLAIETGDDSQLYLDNLALLQVPLACVPGT